MSSKRLHKPKNSSNWYFRAKVPEELRELYGKREEKRSLKTSNKKEAEELAVPLSWAFDKQIEALRTRLQSNSENRKALSECSKRDIDQMAIRWFQEKLDALGLDASIDGSTRHEALNELLLDETDLINKDDSINSSLLNNVTRIAADNELRLEERFKSPRLKRRSPQPYQLSDEDLNSSQYDDLKELVRRGLLELTRQGIAGLEGDYSGEIADKLFRVVIEGERSAVSPAYVYAEHKPSITLEELKDRFFKFKGHTNDKTKAAKNSYDQMWRILRQQFGAEKPIRELTRDDFNKVFDLVKNQPRHKTQRYPDYTYEQAAEKAKAEGLKKLDEGTVNSYMGVLHGMMVYALQEDFVDKNLAMGLSLKNSKKDKAKKKRLPFDDNQLTKIFNAPLYTGCKDGFRGYTKAGSCIPNDLARYWAPLISLYTGMRMGEILQLHTADVRIEDDTWCIFITTEVNDDGELDESDLKRVKTDAGERYVPIHPELKQLGFLEHVKLRSKQNERRLFPELKKGSDGYFSSPFSKWFKRFLVKEDAKTSRTAFHSFRHNFRDRMREAGLIRDEIIALGGWTKQDYGADDGYGTTFKPSTLAKRLALVSYPDIDLSHLYKK